MTKLSFSGHESFICRQFWLKKGYDFVKKGGGFKDEKAVIDLGVGKNMVASVRFWLKAFGLTDVNDTLTQLAEYLFGNKGKDPYLEDFGTLWLLHYHLLKTGRASTYSLVFNEFRKERIDFTKEQLFSLANKIEERFNKVKSQIDKLPQSVLAKAFRGELVKKKHLEKIGV